MPKIIFTSQYMWDAPPAQLENYVKYIGTREGVEKIDESRRMPHGLDTTAVSSGRIYCAAKKPCSASI